MLDISAKMTTTGIAKPDGFDGFKYALLRARFRHESIEWFAIQQHWTQTLIKNIKARVPAGLDKLRDSVHFDADAANHPEKSVAGEHLANIVIDDPSAKFVEYGTSHMAARPFVRPAIEDSKREFEHYVQHEAKVIVLRVLLKILTGGLSR
jgi:HK97 gp10 family phage protein